MEKGDITRGRRVEEKTFYLTRRSRPAEVHRRKGNPVQFEWNVNYSKIKTIRSIRSYVALRALEQRICNLT